MEFRFPLPERNFEAVRAQYDAGREPRYAETVVQYTDGTDVRCVDGAWERKRTVRRERLPCPVKAFLCIAVESPAMEPAIVEWKTSRRRRWSYAAGAWCVEFTDSARGCNVEFEYRGDLEVLACSARDGGDLEGLSVPLNDVMACMAFTAFGRPGNWLCGDMPFVRVGTPACPIHPERCRTISRLASLSQPVSIHTGSKLPDVALVSLKYDGVRLQLVVDPPYAYGICRRGYTWSIPLVSCATRMVLDCEYMHASRSFVVFDLFEHKGRPATGSYSNRLTALSALALPSLMGYTVAAKVIYPTCVLTDAWYEEHRGGDADGVIVHDGTSRLGETAHLHKWKPVHTVDLYVGPGGVLMDGKFTPFMKCTRSGLVHGEIWECRFSGDTVVPIKRRTDKSRANARHVCREIRRAHEAGLGATDVGAMLAGHDRVRVSKRARGI